MDKGGRRGPSHWTNPPSIPWTAGCNRSWSSPRSGSAIGLTVRVTPGRHSGLTILTRFHNFLYAELSLDFVYKAFTTTDLAAAIAGIRALGIPAAGAPCPTRRSASSSWTLWTPRPRRRVGEHHREHRRTAVRLQHRLPGRRQAPGRPPGPGGSHRRRARQRGHGQGRGRGA